MLSKKLNGAILNTVEEGPLITGIKDYTALMTFLMTTHINSNDNNFAREISY